MHYHGGGYTDIKQTAQSWRPSFEKLNESGMWAIGYQERINSIADIWRWVVKPFLVSVNGTFYHEDRPVSRLVSIAHWLSYITHSKKLIGMGAFIFRPRTPLTAAWLRIVEARLDILGSTLEANPGKMGRYGKQNSGDGYPVPWAFILGEILQPLVLEHRKKVLRSLPPPGFTNYM